MEKLVALTKENFIEMFDNELNFDSDMHVDGFNTDEPCGTIVRIYRDNTLDYQRPNGECCGLYRYSGCIDFSKYCDISKQIEQSRENIK